jgi:hypothetical protein
MLSLQVQTRETGVAGRTRPRRRVRRRPRGRAWGRSDRLAHRFGSQAVADPNDEREPGISLVLSADGVSSRYGLHFAHWVGVVVMRARIGADHLGHSKVSMTQDRYMPRGRVHTQVADLLDRTSLKR